MLSRFRSACLLLATIGFAADGWSANPTVQYTVKDLGTLNAAFSTRAMGINNKGEVVGYGGVDANNDHAFRYANGVMTDLGTMGGSTSRARGISTDGLIAGEADTFYSTSTVAMIYSGGNMSSLTTFGGTRSGVNAVSPNGTLAGSARPFGDTGFRGFIRFPNGAISQVPFLTGTDTANFAYGTNDSGYTVGDSTTAGGRNVAYIYALGILSLDSRASLDSAAFAINNATTMVVGSAVFGASTHAASFVANSIPTDLGTLPGGDYSEAYAVNDAKTVVGTSNNGSDYHGFVIPNADASLAMVDLNDVIVGGSPFTIERADAINASGQIAATGSANGGMSHALLLTPYTAPTPTPTPAAPTIAGKKSLKTSSATLTVKGTATGSVTSITYKAGSKKGTAKGTTSWSFKASKLEEGKNIVTVTAHGPGGDSAPLKIIITRK